MSQDLFNPQELDIIIEEVTVRCVGDDEQHVGFGDAFAQVGTFPFAGTVLGHPVDVLWVRSPEDRRELVAECQHQGQQYQVALLDVEPHADPVTTRLMAAYRRWAGT